MTLYVLKGTVFLVHIIYLDLGQPFLCTHLNALGVYFCTHSLPPEYWFSCVTSYTEIVIVFIPFVKYNFKSLSGGVLHPSGRVIIHVPLSVENSATDHH